MGLRRRDLFRRRAAGWAVPAIAAAAALAAELAGDEARLLLRYERAAIADGELWRLLSGHIVHLDVAHLMLNVAGLALVWILVGRAFRPFEWLAVFGLSVAVIDAGFWWMLPELQWYVGLSGVLHGLFAAGLVGSWRVRPGESALLGIVLAAKLAWEQFGSSLPGTSAFVSGEVVTEAHLYGALGGLLAGLVLAVADAFRAGNEHRGERAI